MFWCRFGLVCCVVFCCAVFSFVLLWRPMPPRSPLSFPLHTYSPPPGVPTPPAPPHSLLPLLPSLLPLLSHPMTVSHETAKQKKRRDKTPYDGFTWNGRKQHYTWYTSYYTWLYVYTLMSINAAGCNSTERNNSDRVVRAALFVGLGLGFWQQASGSEAAVYYSPHVLEVRERRAL